MAFRILLLLCLLSVSLRSQSVVRKANKPAKVEAEKYRSSAKSTHKASRAKRKAQTDAIWSGIKPPPDIFSSLSIILRTVMGKYYSPKRVMKKVQKISKKVYFGKKLSLLEKTIWKSARLAIIRELYTSNCNIFISKRAEEWGGCCRILAYEKYFGFCLLLRGLAIPPSRVRTLSMRTIQTNEYETIQSVSMNNGLTPFSIARWYETYEESIADEVIYVDLLSLSCYPPDLGLCSQYCCDGNNQDGVFCNSDFECY